MMTVQICFGVLQNAVFAYTHSESDNALCHNKSIPTYVMSSKIFCLQVM